MRNQFSRTQLHFGQEGMERLNHARVIAFGIGTLDLIGDDRACLTNPNRQLLASRKTVGQYKVDVAEQRAKKINPDAVVPSAAGPIVAGAVVKDLAQLGGNV